MRFCATHITPSNDVIDGRRINEQQLDYVKHRLESFHAGGGTVIVAGDFNARPNYARLDNWYSASVSTPHNANNTGAYRELDDTDGSCPGYGEGTFVSDATSPCGTGIKLDMIFVRENRLGATPYTADSLAPSNACGGLCSDHRIVTATVTVRVNA